VTPRMTRVPNLDRAPLAFRGAQRFFSLLLLVALTSRVDNGNRYLVTLSTRRADPTTPSSGYLAAHRAPSAAGGVSAIVTVFAGSETHRDAPTADLNHSDLALSKRPRPAGTPSAGSATPT